MEAKNKIKLPLEKSVRSGKVGDVVLLVLLGLVMLAMFLIVRTDVAEVTNTPTVIGDTNTSREHNLSSISLPTDNLSFISLPTDGPKTEIIVQKFEDIILEDLIPAETNVTSILHSSDLEDGAKALNTMVASANTKPNKEQTFHIVPVKTNNKYVSRDSKRGYAARTTVKVKKRNTKSGKKVWSIKKVTKLRDYSKGIVKGGKTCNTGRCQTVVVLSKRSKEALDLALDDSDGSIKTVRRVMEIIKTFKEKADKNDYVNDGTLITEIATHYSQKNIDAIWDTFEAH